MEFPILLSPVEIRRSRVAEERRKDLGRSRINGTVPKNRLYHSDSVDRPVWFASYRMKNFSCLIHDVFMIYSL